MFRLLPVLMGLAGWWLLARLRGLRMGLRLRWLRLCLAFLAGCRLLLTLLLPVLVRLRLGLVLWVGVWRMLRLRWLGLWRSLPLR